MEESRTTEQSIESQSAFFDGVFADETRKAVGRVYTVCRTSSAAFRQAIADRSSGARVLEYGCGHDSHGLRVAHIADHVDAIDISPVGVNLVTEEARRRGVSNLTCHVMNAEQLQFPDSTFDLVCGSAILHHLSLQAAMSELRRVLKPGGQAVFFEPLGMNPLIELFRRLTPQLRVPDEHPLKGAQLSYIREVFPAARFTYFHLFGLLSVPFRSTRLFWPAYRLFEGLDRILFRFVPPLRRLAWVVVIVLKK